MKSLLAAALLGLSTLVGVCPTRVEATTVIAVKQWQCAGKYRSYNSACKKANYLESCGYYTKITKTYDNCYEVWYK